RQVVFCSCAKAMDWAGFFRSNPCSVQTDAASRDYLAEYHYGSADAPHTEAYLCATLSICARSCARAASSILGAAMARYAASLQAADTKSLVASRALTAFGSHRIRRQSWCSTNSEWTTRQERLAARALTW